MRYATLRSVLPFAALIATSACSGEIMPAGTERDVDGSHVDRDGDGVPDLQRPDGGGGSGGGGPIGELPTVDACEDAPLSAGSTTTRRLGAAEYRNTVRDVLGVTANVTEAFPEEPRFAGFDATITMQPDAILYGDAASLVASSGEVMAGPAVASIDCLRGTGTPSSDCIDELVGSLGLRLFRRPLEAEETATWRALFQRGQADLDLSTADAAGLVAEAMLQSPEFLYLLDAREPVDGSPELDALTPHALAARLAAFVWQSAPDDTLLAAADDGSLRDPAVLERETRRMLADDKAKRSLVDFHEQLLWLRTGPFEQRPTLLDKTLDGWSPELLASFRGSFAAQIDGVIRGGDASFATLMTGEFVYADERMSGLLDMDAVSGTDFERVDMPRERAGILAHPLVFAVHSNAVEPSETLTGQVVRERLLCQPLPPPPDDVSAGGEDHSAPGCVNCHEKMDPIGEAFRAFDPFGRVADGSDVAEHTATVLHSDIEGELAGLPALGAALAGSDAVHECYTRQWFRYALSRDLTAADACSVSQALHRFKESDLDINELVIGLVTSDAFRFRPAREEGGVCE